jgi:uncharacterized protein
LDYFLAALIIFFGVFTQSTTGFGSGLVTMAFLPALLGIRVAAPLVALLNLVTELIMMIRYRRSFQLRKIWLMIASSLAMIPLGVWMVSNLDEKQVLRVLGFVMVSFSIWALSGVQLPELRHPAWKAIAGGLGGVLGGAYNTSGPPVIIYGNCQRWDPQTFKANLTGYFILNSIFIVTNHIWSGNTTEAVWVYFLTVIPAIAVGMLAGFSLDRRLNPILFRKIVLLLLLIMGIRFIIA